MAFVNKYLTDEEKKRFEELKIENPVRFRLVDNLLDPVNWTVDEERKIALVECGIRDREMHEIKTYAFINTEIKEKDILVFDIIRNFILPEQQEKLKKEYNVDAVVNWKLKEVYNLDLSHVISSKDEFYQILEEALSAYGINGMPDCNYSVKAIIK